MIGATGRGRILDDDGGIGQTWVADGNVCWPTPPDFPGSSCDVGFDNIYCPPGGHLNLRLAAPATVHWSTMDGTATAGVDFVGVADQVQSVAAGAPRATCRCGSYRDRRGRRAGGSTSGSSRRR